MMLAILFLDFFSPTNKCVIYFYHLIYILVKKCIDIIPLRSIWFWKSGYRITFYNRNLDFLEFLWFDQRGSWIQEPSFSSSILGILNLRHFLPKKNQILIKFFLLIIKEIWRKKYKKKKIYPFKAHTLKILKVEEILNRFRKLFQFYGNKSCTKFSHLL